MKKQDYVIQSIRDNKQLLRGWLLSMLGILPLNSVNIEVGLKTEDNKMYASIDNEWVELEDYAPGTPYLDKNAKLSLKAGDLSMIKEDILTTYGILIINAISIQYPYEGIVPYINGFISDKALNTAAYNALKSGSVTVDQHIKFENSISMLTAISQTVVPSASRRSVTPNPEVPMRKAELLEENKDNLHDPATVAMIQSKLVQLDKDYLKGDSSLGFFIKGKSLNMTRLRTMSMYGAEPDFYDESKISVIKNSLLEGWTVKDLPTLISSSRGGSYSRSQSTALGGAEVKTTARIFQNYTVSKTDCNTDVGVKIRFNKDNYFTFIGRYVVGADEPLALTDCQALVSNVVHLRSPAFCKTPGTCICYKCIGDNVANSGVGITALATTVTSSFLSLFMALTHTSELSLKRYDYINRIT